MKYLMFIALVAIATGCASIESGIERLLGVEMITAKCRHTVYAQKLALEELGYEAQARKVSRGDLLHAQCRFRRPDSNELWRWVDNYWMDMPAESGPRLGWTDAGPYDPLKDKATSRGTVRGNAFRKEVAPRPGSIRDKLFSRESRAGDLRWPAGRK